MRILFLGDITHPNAISWIDGLKSQGCEVEVWSLPKPNGRIGVLNRYFHWLKGVIEIKRIIKKNKPHLLIGYRITSYGFIGGISGFHPLVVASQGETDVWPPDSYLYPLKRLLAKYCLKRADLIHAWGKHIAESNIEIGASPEKIMIKPRGVNLKKFYIDNPEKKDFKELRIVVTRSLYPEYRHSVILKATAIAINNGIPISLHIVGEGPLKQELENEVNKLGLSKNIIFHGKVENNKLPEILRKANVYVSMPITEGVSASLFEAMTCGCFPIVSDLTANRNWIENGKNGFLIPIDDIYSLATAFENTYSNSILVQHALLQNISIVMQNASLENNMNMFVESYKNLIKRFNKDK